MSVRVLMVVEDEPDMRVLLRITLGTAPEFDIDGEAADAESAIELAREVQPDLIILDHRLGGPLTGLSAAPMIKDAAPNVRIILFTASEELRGSAEAEPAVDAFLLKTRIADLIPTARRLLAG